MPTETFLRLSEEKKEKIVNAAKKEFARVAFSETSIKNIVEDADIARGSFYQYFESKEDLLQYILSTHAKFINKQTEEILTASKGDIFEFFIAMYDHITDEFDNTDDFHFYKRIFENIKTCDDRIFSMQKEEIKPNDFSKYYHLIDKNKLNIEKEDDIRIILEILFAITKKATIKSFKYDSKDESRKDYIKQLEYLKNGILK